MKVSTPLLVVIFSFFLLTSPSYSQIALTGFYLQDFDSMGTTGTTAPSSWRVNVAGDSNGVSTVTPRFNGLTQTSGATNVGLNAGSLNGNDRWLGVYANATGDTRNIQVSFNNQTGVAITQINIEYDMKLWVNRNNSNRWGGFTMEYSTNGTTWTSMGSSLSGSITNQPKFGI